MSREDKDSKLRGSKRIYSALNFFVNAILIRYRRPQIFELCHFFEGFNQLSSHYDCVLHSGDET
jgi:hypothetical protein